MGGSPELDRVPEMINENNKNLKIFYLLWLDKNIKVYVVPA